MPSLAIKQDQVLTGTQDAYRPQLPIEVVHKVIAQSTQEVLVVWMRVNKESNHIARHQLYSHPFIDPSRLVQCLKSSSTNPTPSPTVSSEGQADDSTKAIATLKQNLALVQHLHLVSLPFPIDPHPHPEGQGRKSKAEIIRRSIEVLADFDLFERARPLPSDRAVRPGLFSSLKSMTLRITSRNILLRDDLPGGVARLKCSPIAQVGPEPSLGSAHSACGGALAALSASAVKAGDGVASLLTGSEEHKAHNEIQRIRMSILGQKGAVIGALQKLVSIVEPPVTYAAEDSVYVLPAEGLTAGYKDGLV